MSIKLYILNTLYMQNKLPAPLLLFFSFFLSFVFVVVLVFVLFCFVASDFLTTICHLTIVNVCVIIILSIGNIQISILLLCFLDLFVELTIPMNE